MNQSSLVELNNSALTGVQTSSTLEMNTIPEIRVPIRTDAYYFRMLGYSLYLRKTNFVGTAYTVDE